MKKHWKTAEVLKLLEGLPFVHTTTNPGNGTVASDQLVLVPTEAQRTTGLFIRGFRTDEYDSPGDDFDVEYVELTDGQQSDTGLSTDDPATIRLYAEVMIRLRKAGFTVVDSLSAYF